MKDKYLEKYKELHDLANDMAEIVLQDKDSEEYDAVNRFLADKKNQVNMTQRFERVSEINDIYVKVALRDKASDVDQLRDRIKLLEGDRLRNRRKVTMRLISSMAAAAAVVIFSVILFPLINDNNKEDILADEVVEKNGVRLILESGEVELLRNNRDISLNGVVIAKADGDKLTYGASAADSVVFATIVVPSQSRYTLELADGTEVYLSANSTLKYPSVFSGKERRVELTGEAFFKVAKSNKQFIVKASEVEVLVYGTEFNVDSYDKKCISTTLLSGSVGVRCNVNNTIKELKLSPNQSLTIDNGIARMDNNVNVKRYLAWLDGFFRSDEEPLGILLTDIENWYGVDLEYSDELATRLVSASLNSTMSIESLLRMLQASAHVRVTKVGDKYLIK